MKGVVIAILSPFIVIIALIVTLLGGGASHNNAALDTSIKGGVIPPSLPPAYAEKIETMQTELQGLEFAIDNLPAESLEGDINLSQLKTMFYTLTFGVEDVSSIDLAAFVECFVEFEEREREIEVTVTDEEGNETTETEIETYIVAFPLDSLPEIYGKLSIVFGRTITHEEKANATEAYFQLLYGGTVPTYGDDFLTWIDSIPLTDEPFVGIDGFTVPIGGDWKSVVRSEFGPRDYAPNPYHTGIDFAVPFGSSIYAAMDGTVLFVRYSNTGYGYHIAIDHGGGIITMYCHTSVILVSAGEDVSSGDLIAEVGSTGLSTGPHLHFEVRENGTMVNPRNYLPKGSGL